MTATSMTALDLLDALVRIDSVNPGLDPAGAGETHIADYRPDRQVCIAASGGLGSYPFDKKPPDPPATETISDDDRFDLATGAVIEQAGIPSPSARRSPWRQTASSALPTPLISAWRQASAGRGGWGGCHNG